MSSITPFLKIALANVAAHGDTDIFPYPVEKHVFFDMADKCESVLENMHDSFKDTIKEDPPMSERMLSAVGYTGFRAATQLEPFWNVYFLALVLSVAEDIEKTRLSTDEVFSYRYSWSDEQSTIFDREVSWRAFQEQSIEHAKDAAYVLTCDISDFYPRIYHHRLDNALRRATENSDHVWRIMKILSVVAGNVSYGLPVGGPAARLLSELLLSNVDKLLKVAGLHFCRYADDYHIFCQSREDAYDSLILISERLLTNEGLLLQKAKTRIASSDEFLSTSEFSDDNPPQTEEEGVIREFLSLRLQFDPYSATAVEDYEALKIELGKFDVVGMLGREIRKTRVHQTLTKKLVSALRHVDPAYHDSALITLIENLRVLYPVFPVVMRVVRSLVGEASNSTKEIVFEGVRDLFEDGSYLVRVPVNLLYALRVLSLDKSTVVDNILEQIYQSPAVSPLVRRDIILIMAQRESFWWISNAKDSFMSLSEWERTALIIASYVLGDEGRHWRDHMQGKFTDRQCLVMEWMRKRAHEGNVSVPL